VDDFDDVFKALADSHRRFLLDRLAAENGQTLGELCRNLNMSRQAVTKHLHILETANLVVTVWRGREKLHYLNPVPIHEISRRWINKFEHTASDALRALKKPVKAVERHKWNRRIRVSGSHIAPVAREHSPVRHH
jgi:DNA-binding transcriptional ArsR family regulator